MDLRLDDAQREFRDEVRDWLETNAPRERFAPPSTDEGLAQHRAWERQMFDAGLAAVHWPQEYGGRGMDALSTAIFYDEYLRADAPERLNRLGLGLCGPTLIDVGTPDQQSRWLQNILTCEEIWCQGFSEPGAGSDLASLRTRGVVEGDEIVVDGQKIWTSHSRYADWIFALVRTDTEAPRHRGITFLMIDRHQPGVEVRPIRQMNHASDFAELFFTGVRVPRSHVIGELNDGWRVAMTTLKHERGSGLNTAAHFRRTLDEMIGLMPETLRHDAGVQREVGRLYSEIEAYRYMTLRTLSSIAQDRQPGAQASMGKLWWSEMQVRLHEFGLRMVGERAELIDLGADEPSTLLQRYWLGRAAQIYAGSSEIQRNIIAERVLGLPKGTNRAV
ncbi:acyl-CoA dehydrogenase family protein [Aeromicrobium chenweiae]|uniref:Acyl-CoA dehydrogenase n=1 Tax=Aeromicrobium chenweiae TaxID=2079793 RepID=A0A2S0WPN5_9ACTN|nr:acyl-CoA dehydrogenase family protein [Aeromicrobium chenweiae]AWB93240.1 acyl-CoA dehydrogenase [Aeromicrobium chenweiae]TGN34233.1 acyl-CoA dehydrogenase [Aeromicrobium chenweiae]